MKNIFFRTTSLWASVLYMALGLVLTFWPGMSGTVFLLGHRRCTHFVRRT